VTLGSLLDTYQRFKEIYRPHFQGRRSAVKMLTNTPQSWQL